MYHPDTPRIHGPRAAAPESEMPACSEDRPPRYRLSFVRLAPDGAARWYVGTRHTARDNSRCGPRHLRISCRTSRPSGWGHSEFSRPCTFFRSTVAATLGRCGRGRAATGVGMRVLPFLRFCPETGAELTRGRSEPMAWRSGSDYLTATKDHILEMQRL